MCGIHSIFASTVMASVLSLSLSIAAAQGPGVGGPNGFGGVPNKIPVRRYRSNPAFQWIGIEAVQDDLKLTDKQKDQIKAAKAALDKKEQALWMHPGNVVRLRSVARDRPDRADAPAPAKSEPPPEAMDWSWRDQAFHREVDLTYSKILTKAQLHRLNQIHMQQLGPFFAIVDDPRMAEKLNLSEEQLFQIQQIEMELAVEKQRNRYVVRSRLQNIKGDDGKINSPQEKKEFDKFKDDTLKQARGLREKRTAALSKILTKKQRASFNKMLGAPFDISKLVAPGAGTAPMRETTK